MTRHDRLDRAGRAARRGWADVSPTETPDTGPLGLDPFDAAHAALVAGSQPIRRLAPSADDAQPLGEPARSDGGPAARLRSGPGGDLDSGDGSPWPRENRAGSDADGLSDLFDDNDLFVDYDDPPDERAGPDEPPAPADHDSPGGRDHGWRPGSGPRRGPAGRLPAVLRGAIWDPATRGAVLLALTALVAAAVAAGFAWHARPARIDAVATPNPSGEPSGGFTTGSWVGPASAWTTSPPTPSSAPSTATEVVVDVAGRVRQPGVVSLPAGSRVTDAIEKAGGVLPGTDTTDLALARPLVDGEQILVDGKPGPAPAGPAGVAAAGGAGASASAGPVHLNSATVDQLDTLPGVGPVLAQRIVQWRDANGPFTSPDQLGEVPGVGDRRLQELLPLITL